MSDYLILSDTHGKGALASLVLSRQIRRPDALLFAGDGLRDIYAMDVPTVYAVKGNCDGYPRLLLLNGQSEAVPEERVFYAEDKKIFLLHGHTRQVKHGLGAAIGRAVELDADAIVFGHTHMPICYTLETGNADYGVTLKKPLCVFNPGSLAFGGSFGTLTVRSGQMLFSHGSI